MQLAIGYLSEAGVRQNSPEIEVNALMNAKVRAFVLTPRKQKLSPLGYRTVLATVDADERV